MMRLVRGAAQAAAPLLLLLLLLLPGLLLPLCSGQHDEGAAVAAAGCAPASWQAALPTPSSVRAHVHQVVHCVSCYPPLVASQRLHRVLTSDKPDLNVAFIGGSVTAQGLFLEPLRAYVEALLCGRKRVAALNYGVPASTPAYPAYCLQHMLGETLRAVDVFVIDFGINDLQNPATNFELLLRTILGLEQAPAVVLYDHTSIKHRAPHEKHLLLAAKYGAPTFSIVPAPFIQRHNGASAAYLYRDGTHPSEAGAQVIAAGLA